MVRRLVELFFAFPGRLDGWLRWRDLRRHRIDGTWLHRLGLVRGYSPLAFWLPIPVLFLFAWGMPLRWRGGWTVASLALVLAFHALGCRLFGRRGVPLGTWAMIVMFGLGTWLAAEAGSREADSAPYRHVLQWVGVIAATLAIPANRWWAECILGGCRGGAREVFASNLARAHLFVRPQPVSRDFSRVLRAYTMVVLASPWLLGLLVALVVLIAPWQLLELAFLASTALFVFLLGAVHFNPRLNAFREHAQQALFVGGPRFVSLAVMALAAARLAGVDYVTTLLDHWQTRLVALFWILAWYFLFWLYNYWTQRAAAEVLLGMLDTRPEPESHPIDVPYCADCRLQLHGAGRFMVLTPGEDPVCPLRFQAYKPQAVFRRVYERLLAEARVGSDDENEDEADDVRWALAHRAESVLRDVDQRLRIYNAVPALLLAAAIAAIVVAHYRVVQDPLIAAPPGRETVAGDYDLLARWRSLGTNADGSSAAEPVLMVVASGGGTRAALYTYSALRGIADRGALDRLLVMSGVSGGSASLAHFAAHRAVLCADAPRAGEAWRQFRDSMAAPHVRDVLAGIGEWRGLGGIRLGHLLAESLDRRFASNADRTLGAAATSRCAGQAVDAAGIGLLFNTALTGSARWRGGQPPRTQFGSSRLAGGRLVLTNLRGLDFQQGLTPDGWPHDLPLVVIGRGEVELARAAALSANFPPVFPDAAVDAVAPSGGGLLRYWVTDGGAVENRGILSLLLALRAVLEPLPAAVREGLPPAKILVVEASAFSDVYQERNRGAGAKLAASRQLANQLIAELVREVGALAQVEVVYLPMPSPLRVAGSLGTHWMMPFGIHVSPAGEAAGARLWLRRDRLLEVVDALFDPSARDQVALDPPDLERLWRWLTAAADPATVLDRALMK